MVRYKNRYIIIEIVSKSRQDKKLELKTTAIHNAIQQKVQQMFGDFGLAAIKAGFNAKYCNPKTKIGLIKVRHGPHKFVLNAIPSITDIGGNLVEVKILNVSGTMMHSQLFIINHQSKVIRELWSDMMNIKEMQELANSITAVTAELKDFK